jgi:hypothetical protein
VFTPIPAIFGLLFFASTLPNGIRLVELPSEGDSVQIVAGYTTRGLSGLDSTTAAKSLLFDAYAAGGSIGFVNELDRTGVRLTIPKWALPEVLEHLPAFFSEVPQGDKSSDIASPDFRANVEEEIRSALLGAEENAPAQYATDNAFVLISEPAPGSLRDALAAIPKRASSISQDDQIRRLSAERTLRFKSDLPTGGLIFASPIPGVYYKQWYLVLLLDRVIQGAVPLKLKTALPLTVHPYYYRMELSIPAGQFPEPAEENLLQEIQRLQFTRADPRVLSDARGAAVAYLNSGAVREWFASHDLSDRRDEGVQWIELMTADDLRVAARDLLLMNHVIASWAPKPQQTVVAVEDLRSVSKPIPVSRLEPSTIVPATEGAASRYSPFALHKDSTLSMPLAERLVSGVSLIASNVNAVFLSGGALSRFDHELTAGDLTAFQKYRPERILVLAPQSSLDRQRQLWSSFKGTPDGEVGVPKGNISSGDLPALFVLKTIVDLRIIENGWWREADLRIDASEGSALQIRADAEKSAEIAALAREIDQRPPSEDYFAWVREVAIHRFDRVRADLQALTWEHDPQGTIQDLETVSEKHVQDVARIYF